MSNDERPAVAVTMGDPCGIGPEVVAKALAQPWVYAACRPLVVGNALAMERAIALTGARLRVNPLEDPEVAGRDPTVLDLLDPGNLEPADITPGQISPPCGRASMEWVAKAGQLALDGKVAALATAPLNKEAAALSGYQAIGHMELLQELSGAKTVATMLMAKNLRVVHLTTHRSLRLACDYVKKEPDFTISAAYPRQFRPVGHRQPSHRRGRLESPRQRRGAFGQRRRGGNIPRRRGGARPGDRRYRTRPRRRCFPPGH